MTNIAQNMRSLKQKNCKMIKDYCNKIVKVHSYSSNNNNCQNKVKRKIMLFIVIFFFFKSCEQKNTCQYNCKL